MKHKVLLILGFIGLTIVESCCDMRDGKPYFKISELRIGQQYPNFDTYDFGLIFNGDNYYVEKTFSFPSLCNQAVAFGGCEGGAPDGFKGAKETMDSISIITLNDFNASYKANSSINDLVDAYSVDNTKMSVAELIQTKPIIRRNAYTSGYFKLKSKPQDSFKIEIKVKLSNGDVLKARNIPILF